MSPSASPPITALVIFQIATVPHLMGSPPGPGSTYPPNRHRQPSAKLALSTITLTYNDLQLHATVPHLMGSPPGPGFT